MATEDFRTRLGRLRTVVGVFWVLNFLILAATIEAGIIFFWLSSSSSNREIGSFLLTTIPIALIVSAIVMIVVDLSSHRMLVSTAAPGAKEVTQGQIFNIVEEMMIAGGVPESQRPTVYIAPSTQANAFVVSNGRKSLMVFTSAIVESLNREQLQAVAAHEMGHLIAGDSKAMTKVVAMSSMVAIISGSMMRIFRGNNDSKNPLALVLIIASFVFLLIAPLLSSMAQAAMSRTRESQADALAVQLSRNPTALSEALQIISQQPGSPSEAKTLAKAKDLAIFSFSKHLATHPPMEKRIAALRSMGATV